MPLELMMRAPTEESYWVVPGKLLAGPHPRAFHNVNSKSKFEKLAAAGITSFIDLTEEGELSPYDKWLKSKTQTQEKQKHQRFPIRDHDVPSSKEYAKRILDAIDADIEDGHTVYVHCFGGIGRTGTIIGCWLARHPDVAAPGSALERLQKLWSQCSKSAYTHSPETLEQAEYVRDW